jgi:hypothetical protein
MHPGDGLHHASVTMPETTTISGFHLCRIGGAVLGDRYTRITLDHAGHTGGP